MFSARIPFGFLLMSAVAVAQQYTISTVAGGAPTPTPIEAAAAAITGYLGVATDAAGNVYLTGDNCVFKVDSTGVLTRIAGTSRGGYSGDGGPAAIAQLNAPAGVVVDGSGNLYIADSEYNRIRKVSPDGIITTVAGNGTTEGYTDSRGDGGPAVNAPLSNPVGLAIDRAGSLYIADSENNRIRKVLPNGIIATIAGNGTQGYSGDGGPAIDAQLNDPQGVAVDTAGNLYIADYQNNCIRKVSPDGIITTVAGIGSPGLGTGGYSGDGGPAINAELSDPTGVAVDTAANLFIADRGNARVRKVSSNGTITTVAGGVCCGSSGDNGQATSAGLVSPWSLAMDGSGNLYIGDFGGNRVRKVSASGIITTVAGNGSSCCYSGDGGPAIGAQLNTPGGVSVDASGDLYIADSENNRIRKVLPNGIIATIAGNGTQGYSGDGGPAIDAQLNDPQGVAVDTAGNLYITDQFDHRIRTIMPNGVITSIAVTLTDGYGSDYGLGADSSGDLYFADPSNYRIQKIAPSGTTTTVAGNGTQGYSGDGGPATSAQLCNPLGVATDSSGDLYFADGRRVRKVSSSGTISSVANLGVSGCDTAGSLQGVAVDASGILYILDAFNIWSVSPNGTITSIAGNGAAGYSGDGGPATDAQISYPSGVVVDGRGDVYVADTRNNAIRLLQPTNQAVLLSAVVDAASEQIASVSPGKIVVLYGGGLGPATLAQNQPMGGAYSSQLSGTTVSFDGIAAPLVYTSATQVAATVPYEITGTTAQVTVSYQGQASSPVMVQVAAASPSIFTLNETGAGQAAAINAVDGSINTAANPVKIGGYISLYATGEGQTTPAGVDGKIASGPLLPAPNLKVSATVGGITAVVQYAGAAPGEVAGVMQVNIQIPTGVQPGGYVPVVLQVGNTTTTPGAVWIAVGN